MVIQTLFSQIGTSYFLRNIYYSVTSLYRQRIHGKKKSGLKKNDRKHRFHGNLNITVKKIQTIVIVRPKIED